MTMCHLFPIQNQYSLVRLNKINLELYIECKSKIDVNFNE